MLRTFLFTLMTLGAIIAVQAATEPPTVKVTFEKSDGTYNYYAAEFNLYSETEFEDLVEPVVKENPVFSRVVRYPDEAKYVLVTPVDIKTDQVEAAFTAKGFQLKPADRSSSSNN